MTIEDSTAVPRTLGLGASLMRRGHMVLFVGGVFAVPVLVAVLVLIALAPHRGDQNGALEVLRAAWKEAIAESGNEWMLWALVVLVPLAVILTAVQSTARIHVSSLGLQAYIPKWLGLGVFGQTTGRWDLLWDSVQRVELVLPAGKLKGIQRLGWYRLVITTATEEVHLNPFAWFERAGPDHRLTIGELLRPRAVDTERRVRESPLIQAVRARGFEIEEVETDRRPVGGGFDLASHRGAVVLLAVIFLAGFYALVDTFFVNGYRALEPLPAAPFVEVAVIAGLGAWLLGRGAPRLEHAVLGTLAVAAVVAAVYPAMLRFNAATAQPEVVSYGAVAVGRFESAEGSLPRIDLTDLDIGQYWAGYPAGATHNFTLLRGQAGFYQLDLAPLFARTRAFYRTHDDG